MNIEKKLENGSLTFALTGRLDTTTSPQFEEALFLAFDEAEEIVLDFAKLTYVSSAGLRILLMGQKAARAKEGSMIILNVPDVIMEVFEMTGFSDILTFV